MMSSKAMKSPAEYRPLEVVIHFGGQESVCLERTRSDRVKTRPVGRWAEFDVPVEMKEE